MIIPIFTPHGGCPERCHFCDQNVSGGTPVSSAKVTATIEEHLATTPQATEVAFYGGTFTSMPRSRQLAYLECVRPFIEAGRVGGVRIATRPDAIEESWIRHLATTYRLSTVELGVQSFHEPSLKALGRSHSTGDLRSALRVLENFDVKTSLHLMLGCPEEPLDIDERTLSEIVELRAVFGGKPDFVRIHPLLILKGTELEQRFYSGAYLPLALETAVERAAWLTTGLEKAGVGVIRLGLQANDLLGQAVVAGPYHPGFGDLVKGRILRNRVSEQIKALLSAPQGAVLELLAPERLCGPLKGPQKSNLEWFKSRFGLSLVTVRVLNDRLQSYDEIEVRFHYPSGPA